MPMLLHMLEEETAKFVEFHNKKLLSGAKAGPDGFELSGEPTDLRSVVTLGTGH